MNDGKRSLEERLAATDFSDQSRIRDDLRRDLMRRIAREDREAGSTRSLRGRFEMFRRPIPAFGLGVLAAALLLTLAHPDGRAALAKLPGLLHIGEHTAYDTEKHFSDAQLDSLVSALDVQQQKGEQITQVTPYGGWGGAVPEGGDPYIKEVHSLPIAAGLVDYPLLVPTYFNEKLPPRLRFQKVDVFPDGQSVLYFGVGWMETVIHLIPVGEQGMVSFMETIATRDQNGQMTYTMVEPELQEMQVAGRKVVWKKHDEGARRNLGGVAVERTDVEIGRFLWEQDGLSCVLDGKFLTKEEGVRIIESLTRYGER